MSEGSVDDRAQRAPRWEEFWREVRVKAQPAVTQVTQVAQVKQVTRKACTPVAMPLTAIRNNGIYPCIVDGEIKPAVFRAKDSRSVSQKVPGQLASGQQAPGKQALSQLAPSTSTTS